MKNTIKFLCATVLVGVNLGVGLVVGWYFWLNGIWIIDDSVADRLDSFGWAQIAGERAIRGLIVGIIVGTTGYFLNRFVFRFLFPDRRPPKWYLAGAAGLIIEFFTIMGSLVFFFDKPYM